MIALIIIPLTYADPESRKVLVHDESKPSQRFAGEGGEGFYYIPKAAAAWQAQDLNYFWRNAHCMSVIPHTLPLYGVASKTGSDLVAVYVEHFDAPTDYDDHFEDTPLLTLPDVPEDAPEQPYDPETHVWKAGDWFCVTVETGGGGDRAFVHAYGAGPHKIAEVSGNWVRTMHDWWGTVSQIRPCPPPQEGGSQ